MSFNYWGWGRRIWMRGYGIIGSTQVGTTIKGVGVGSWRPATI